MGLGKLPQEEFSYNSFVNRPTGKSLFQIVYGQNPQGVLDIVSLPWEDRITNDGVSFVEHLHQLQQDVRQKLHDSNMNYKIFFELKSSQNKEVGPYNSQTVQQPTNNHQSKLPLNYFNNKNITRKDKNKSFTRHHTTIVCTITT